MDLAQPFLKYHAPRGIPMPIRLASSLLLLATAITARGADGEAASGQNTGPSSTPTPAAAPTKESEPEAEPESGRMRVMDVRLAFGLQHGPRHIHDDYDSGTGSANSTGGYDYAVHAKQNEGVVYQATYAMSIGPLRDWGGMVWAAGLRGTGHRVDLRDNSASQTQNLSYGTFGVIGEFSYAYAFAPIWHVEVGPLLSFGGASIDWPDRSSGGTYSDDTAHGNYVQGGVRGGTYVAVWQHFVLGFDLEWTGTLVHTRVDHPATGGTSHLTIHEHGLGGLLTAGYRF
jgi:hypothetical protein